MHKNIAAASDPYGRIANNDISARDVCGKPIRSSGKYSSTFLSEEIYIERDILHKMKYQKNLNF